MSFPRIPDRIAASFTDGDRDMKKLIVFGLLVVMGGIVAAIALVPTRYAQNAAMTEAWVMTPT